MEITTMQAAAVALPIFAYPHMPLLTHLLLQAVARRFNVKAVSVWLLPIRDFFSFYIYLISFLPSRVRWKGRDFMIEADGSMIARRGSK